MSGRVRVRFRYRADTGEVEMFTVDAVGDTSAADHDLRHDRVTDDIAQVIEANARIEEVIDPADADSDGREQIGSRTPADADEIASAQREGPLRG